MVTLPIIGPIGATGVTGATGATGSTGATGAGMGALYRVGGVTYDIGAPPLAIGVPQTISGAVTLGTNAAANNGFYLVKNYNYFITLPTSSLATNAQPICYTFSKNDGTGPVILRTANQDTFDNGKTTANIYNENCTLITFGTGVWYWLERQRGLISMLGATASGQTSQASPLSFSIGLTDTDLEEVSYTVYNFTPSGACNLGLTLLKSGTAGNSSGSSVYTSSTSASTVNGTSAASVLFIALPGGAINASTQLTFRRPWSTVAGEQFMDWKSLTQNAGFGAAFGSGYDTRAAALTSFQLFPYNNSTSPTASFIYTVRGFRT